jgi:hypothetical protein
MAFLESACCQENHWARGVGNLLDAEPGVVVDGSRRDHRGPLENELKKGNRHFATSDFHVSRGKAWSPSRFFNSPLIEERVILPLENRYATIAS